MSTSLIAAPHLKVFINGRLLGWAFGIHYKKRTPVRELFGIDCSIPSELAFTTYHVQGTIQIYRGRYQGEAEGLGMSAFANKLLRQKYITIEVVDRITDCVISKFLECVIIDQDWNVAPKGLLSGTFSFLGIDASNEADE
jgi:hypothetical protein